MKKGLVTLRENCLLLLYLLIFFCFLKEKVPLAAFLCTVTIWIQKTKDTSFLYITLLLIIICVPKYSSAVPVSEQGIVTAVHQNYAEVRSGRERFLVYAQEPLSFDSIISVTPEFTGISSSVSFFGFDFAGYCAKKGIRYGTSGKTALVRQLPSVRAYLQRKIEACPDETARAHLAKILLGIRSDVIPDGFLNDSGIALSGVLMFYGAVLGLFLYPADRRRCLIAADIVLMLVYRFPVPLVIRFLDMSLAKRVIDRRERTVCSLLPVVVLFPECVGTASFLLPAAMRLVSLGEKKGRLRRIFVTALLESFLFNEVKVFHILMFRNLNIISGFVWNLALLYLFTGGRIFLSLIMMTDRMMTRYFSFSIPGSPIGAGLPFFLVLLYLICGKKRSDAHAAALLFVFLLFGLFHPFAEISFINVGQGDSILIRAPLNRGNILVDTGKPSARKALVSFLKGKGITKIDTLYVTHEDSDHSGNVSYLQDTYHPQKTVRDHFACEDLCGYRVCDLNTIENEDENQSSLVLYTKMNGLSFLLTGDSDEVTERTLIDKYPGIRADILKLSHHGSRTGSCEIFLDTVRCYLAVISCGDYGIYHHPDEQVTQRLLKRHIPYLITREDGDITVLAAAGVNFLVTASGKIAIIGT